MSSSKSQSSSKTGGFVGQFELRECVPDGPITMRIVSI